MDYHAGGMLNLNRKPEPVGGRDTEEWFCSCLEYFLLKRIATDLVNEMKEMCSRATLYDGRWNTKLQLWEASMKTERIKA